MSLAAVEPLAAAPWDLRDLDEPVDRSDRARYIPRAVAAEVWKRDGGCCSFIGAEGEACRSTYQLEIDHIWPVACGGAATVANLRVLCKSHNLHHARAFFGDAAVPARKRRRSREVEH